MADRRCSKRTHPDARCSGGRPSRREILRLGGLPLFGLTLADLLKAQEAGRPTAPSAGTTGAAFGRAKACILLFMWGGPAQQDTWDLKPEAPAEYRGEFLPIATAVPGIEICEHLPQLAQRVDKLAIVRSLTHTNVDHTVATHFLLTGEPPPPTTERSKQWPHMGSVLSRLERGRGALPPFVSLRPKLDNDVPRFVEESRGQFAGWLGPMYDPMTIDHNPALPDFRVEGLTLSPELSVSRLRERLELRGQFDPLRAGLAASFAAADHNYQRAFDLLASTAEQRGAFNLDEEPDAIRARYGRHAHGQSVLLARRLVERGVPLVTVFWPNDGIKNVSVYWDTHSRNFIDLKERLLPTTDQTFSALLDDLAARGMLDETLVVWTGEFGRTPRVGQRNSDAGAGQDGRDHWPGCFSAVLAGGGVRGGQVYGRSDRHAAYPAEHALAPRDLVATIYHLLGVPEHQVLPDVEGRPQFVRPGRVVPELVS